MPSGRPRIYENSYYLQHREQLLEKARAKYFVRRLLAQPPSVKAYAEFWAKVQIGGPNDCWPWLGQLTEKGYGTLDVAGESVRAHLTAWELAQKKPFPKPLMALHTCDHPACCNPVHVYSGTAKDNHRDAVKRGRTRIGMRGAGNHNARLTQEQIDWARIAYTERGKTWAACVSIAEELGVTPGHINNVIKGRFWKQA